MDIFVYNYKEGNWNFHLLRGFLLKFAFCNMVYGYYLYIFSLFL